MVSIGAYAFQFCTSLTDIYYEGTVAEWNDVATGSYWNLNTNVAMHLTDGGGFVYKLNADGESYSVGYVGDIADGNVEIPSSYNGLPVTGIYNMAFYNRADITSVTIPSSITTIEGAAFDGCTGLTAVHITDLSAWLNIDFVDNASNPLSYAHKLYLNGTEVTELVIPNGITEIKPYAFQGCSSLQTVKIPKSAVSIGKFAFYSCSSLTDIYYQGTVAEWNDVVTGSNWNFKTNAAMHFADGGGFTYTPNADGESYSVGYIGDIGDGNIVIPSSYKGLPVTGICYKAFYNRTEITSVTIPSSIKTIEDSAFSLCKGLTAVHITDLSAWLNIDFVNDIGISNPLFYAQKLYLNGTEVTELVIPNGITEIKPYAFRRCTGITSIEIHDSVTSIGNYSFSRCTSLTNIVIPDSVTSIGDGAFIACTSLTNIVLPNGITSISDYVFDECTSLTSIVLPNAITSIGEMAFYDCTSLKSIAIPDSVIFIGNYAFSECSALERVDITDLEAWYNIDFESRTSNPLSYGHDLYLNGELVTTLILPETLSEIKSYAFCGCTSIKSVTVPDSVTHIREGAFQGCTSLTDIYYEGTLAEWSEVTTGSNWNHNTKAAMHLTDGEGFTYKPNADGESYSVGYAGNIIDGNIVIPSSYKGLPVTGIMDRVFITETK